MWKFTCYVVIFHAIVSAQLRPTPEYIKPCRRGDPEITECIKNSLDHLKPYLARGIPEIELPSVEPFKMDALSLQLTDGPQGYKITLKNIEVFGASHFQLKSISLSENDKPFKARIFMPKLKIEATYTSSGVLLIIPASGHGEFHSIFEGVVGDLTGKVSATEKPDGTYLHIDQLSIVIDVKKANMSISRAFNNNRILLEATNLFLRENAKIVLEAMQGQLQKKLANEFGKLTNQLLKHVPREMFYID